MRLFTLSLILLTLLTACASAQTAPTASPVEPTAAPPEAPEVVSDGTFETSLLGTVWKGSADGTLLFPFDPASGEVLPGYKPIPLGFSSTHAFSPDRSKLAVVSFANQSAIKGSLLLIDLPTWTPEGFDLELIGWVNHIVFSPDGKRLAIAHGQSNYMLTIVDLERESIIAQSPTDSFVTRLKFTENGDALMLYSPAASTANLLSAGPPSVLLLDATNLNPLWTAELDGVRDGIFPKGEDVTAANIHEPGQAYYLSPALVFAPDRDTLYVVHADSDQLTTADFESQTIKTVDVRSRLTLFERLLSLTAGVAHAKVADGTVRQAVISPDGKLLYVVGVNHATFQDTSGNWQWEQTPLGLEILQTSDGSRVDHMETDTTELSISPDGRFLYLRSWDQNTPSTEIFDTLRQQVILRKDKLSAMPAWLINGQYLLTSTYSTSDTAHHMSLVQPDGSSVLAEWTDTEYVWWLTP